MMQPKHPVVGVVMGSDSDWPTMQAAAVILKEFGVPFGMFTITKPNEQYVPSAAGWNEMREYAASGNWIIGSHLYGAHYDQAVDKEGKTMRMSLPNRVWLPEKGRLKKK